MPAFVRISYIGDRLTYMRKSSMEGFYKLVAPFVAAAQTVEFQKNKLSMINPVF